MKSYAFLVDVNLPKHFSFFFADNFEFVIDINGKANDRDIWNYAKKKNLVILTKDSDF
jgi:predicted nuclease of predicted toxin-antitoxin system